jgi:hypothetical protein
MGISLRIPGLVTLLIVRTPSEIGEIDDARGVDRLMSGSGGLLNRMIAGKLAVFKTSDGLVWPAFAARADTARSRHQDSLERMLSGDTAGLIERITSEITALAACVRDGSSTDTIGISVQQAVGRLFLPDYVADADSYDAARTLTKWPSAGPLTSWRLRRSGKLQRAIDLVLARAGGDTACAHATALAMHNIVDSVELMQGLARKPGAFAELSAADVIKQVLRAPPRIIREARDEIEVGNTKVRARSLVLMAVEAARKSSPDDGFGFFANHWNRCPAHAFVPRLLGRIWEVAAAKPGAGQ